MSSEKRLVLFLVLTFSSILGIQYFMEKTGLVPPPPPPKQGQGVARANPADALKPAAGQPGVAPVIAPSVTPAAIARAAGKIEVVKVSELILGSTTDSAANGYRLEVQLTQKGAGVESVASSRYHAEFEQGQRNDRPLQLIRRDPKAPPSLSLNLLAAAERRDHVAEGLPGDLEEAAAKAEVPLDSMLWEVERDGQGHVAHPLTDKSRREGREITFRATLGEPAIVIRKTYRLVKGEDGFELGLEFQSPKQARTVAYKLLGPHGIPIEGEWYTGTFRDVFFGQSDGGKVKIVTRSAYDIVKGKAKPERFESLPLKFAGVENQYFAVFVEPKTRLPEERWDSETVATIIHEDPKAQQKADVAVEITSKPTQLGPNLPRLEHTYRVFAGPKTALALTPYGAYELASYRKNQWFNIPFASDLAKTVIAPLLDKIYALTQQVASYFGGKSGNYGIAIILLTLLVRLMMFPLGRKQAISAKKMQDLQPHLKELQEKYKDDKEKQTKETWALYKAHGVNPVGGCLPALIQMPVLVGLWQALNNSVSLRHASFLYIRNLAAPDMLFHFPVEVPFLGNYFNLLPFLVVSLMLVQTKLFAPPATTPEAEMQQKMMKYMMVFMAFMFYKVPSGLGIYFITSSLWQISERLLLPKVTKTPVAVSRSRDDDKPASGGGGRGGPGGNGAPRKPTGWFGQFLEKVLEEAAKDPTIRNAGKEQDKGKPRARPNRRG